MNVFAPGKMLISGAYAVLEGAPAVVISLARGAEADSARPADFVSEEVKAALGEHAPYVSAEGMFERGRKLGLGASAALTVAALGLRAAERGADLASSETRAALFQSAWEAHQKVQQGGSGVDIAASVYGGVVDYRLEQGRPRVAPRTWPSELVWSVFASDRSARTSELRARVDALHGRDVAAFEAVMWPLFDAAARASVALEKGLPGDVLVALRDSAHALFRLGKSAEAPIVLPGHETLFPVAESEGGAFFPSGAGGGDISVFVGSAPPSPAFVSRAADHHLTPLSVSIDVAGVRVVEPEERTR